MDGLSDIENIGIDQDRLQLFSAFEVNLQINGMALAIFFLLLIALSEHICFFASYWVSSIACSGLIGYYSEG